MLLLNIENIYSASFKDSRFYTATGFTGRGANIRAQNYRALNFNLEVFDEDGNLIGTLPGGVTATDTSTHNSPLVRFFRSLGIFRDPEEFNPCELDGMKVLISVNNVFDGHGLHSVVDHYIRQ